MMSARMIEDGEGARAARAQKRRYWRMTVISLLCALAIGLAMIAGTTSPGHMRPAVAIAAVIAMAALAPLAIRYNNRVTDELDQMDMLRANSFGLYVFLIGQFGWIVLASSGLVPQPDAMVAFMATTLATLGRYAMLKFRR